jgi:hypothetical protein
MIQASPPKDTQSRSPPTTRHPGLAPPTRQHSVPFARHSHNSHIRRAMQPSSGSRAAALSSLNTHMASSEQVSCKYPGWLRHPALCESRGRHETPACATLPPALHAQDPVGKVLLPDAPPHGSEPLVDSSSLLRPAPAPAGPNTPPATAALAAPSSSPITSGRVVAVAVPNSDSSLFAIRKTGDSTTSSSTTAAAAAAPAVVAAPDALLQGKHRHRKGST